jgi:hypothetical protein
MEPRFHVERLEPEREPRCRGDSVEPVEASWQARSRIVTNYISAGIGNMTRVFNSKFEKIGPLIRY